MSNEGNGQVYDITEASKRLAAGKTRTAVLTDGVEIQVRKLSWLTADDMAHQLFSAVAQCVGALALDDLQAGYEGGEPVLDLEGNQMVDAEGKPMVRYPGEPRMDMPATAIDWVQVSGKLASNLHRFPELVLELAHQTTGIDKETLKQADYDNVLAIAETAVIFNFVESEALLGFTSAVASAAVNAFAKLGDKVRELAVAAKPPTRSSAS